jgi:hypothetical protein
VTSIFQLDVQAGDPQGCHEQRPGDPAAETGTS